MLQKRAGAKCIGARRPESSMRAVRRASHAEVACCKSGAFCFIQLCSRGGRWGYKVLSEDGTRIDVETYMGGAYASGRGVANEELPLGGCTGQDVSP